MTMKEKMENYIAMGLTASEALEAIKEENRHEEAMAMASKPSRATGRTPKEPKELKTYEAFSYDGKGFKVTSKDSKGGNPNALLVVTFDDIPSAKVRAYLKGCDFRYNANGKAWYTVNDEKHQKFIQLI